MSPYVYAPPEVFAVLLEAAAWRARDAAETGARGSKAEVARIRRAIRALAPSEAQRERLLAIAKGVRP